MLASNKRPLGILKSSVLVKFRRGFKLDDESFSKHDRPLDTHGFLCAAIAPEKFVADASDYQDLPAPERNHP